MSVQSKIDEGTTVTVALPLVFMRPEPQRLDAKSSEAKSSEAKSSEVRPSSNIATLWPAPRSAPQDQVQDQAHQVKKSA
jgi:cell cycle sensor histidine kinase DivJ